jgi:hypothetical protein
MAQYHVAGWLKASQILFKQVAKTEGKELANEYL